MIPVLLLLVLGFALSCGIAMAMLLSKRAKRRTALVPFPLRHFEPTDYSNYLHGHALFIRPSSWLAVKSRNLRAVQSALGLHNAKPCSWIEGLASDEKLFIAPPVKGWIIVLGSALPEPSDDVDACF